MFAVCPPIGPGTRTPITDTVSSMPIYLVRHAKAGSRSAWIGDDRDRPLADDGWAQARALVDLLGVPGELVSSPHLRCRQTLEPLAEATGLSIRIDTRIEEDSPLERSLAALEDVADGAVMCSHGDVIPDMLNGLLRRGMEIQAGAPLALRKASTFVIHREGGRFVRAEYLAPPTV